MSIFTPPIFKDLSPVIECLFGLSFKEPFCLIEDPLFIFVAFELLAEVIAVLCQKLFFFIFIFKKVINVKSENA